MTSAYRTASAPAGFLRLFVVFHESEALGAGRSVLNTVAPLEELGWSVSAWLPEHGALERLAPFPVRVHASKPIRYSVRGWKASPGPMVRLRATPAYLRAFRRALLEARPHVVHVNTLRALPEAGVARSLGLPVVVHVHELLPTGSKGAAAARLAAASADVLVAVSEAAAALLRPHVGRTPIVVAHNGVPIAPRTHDDIEDGTIGTIGTVCRTKGTDVFVEAAVLAHEKCAALRFEHIGESGLDEDAEFRDALSARLSMPEAAQSVCLLGPAPARQGLERWETFVLASRRDAFPLATLEAMAAGVPVVATEVGGVPEQIEHLVTGVLVPPESPRALADWIVRLHDDRELRDRLARAGLARVRERFTVERQAQELHRAYLGALNLRHGPPPVRERTAEAL